MMTQTKLYNEDYLRQEAPAIFSDGAAEHVSDKYSFVPTYRILEEMQKEGFVPMSAKQVSSRGGITDFGKHLVRLRHRDAINVHTNYVPEIVLFNAHNC